MATSDSAATMDQTAKAKEGGTAKVKVGTAKAKEQTFIWMDDEIELLLLKVTHEFKVKKAAESVDWESVRSKYDDIWKEFKLQMPSSPEQTRKRARTSLTIRPRLLNRPCRPN